MKPTTETVNNSLKWKLLCSRHNFSGQDSNELINQI